MHTSVMLNELLKFLDILPDGIYFDCTFGVGGHSLELNKYLNRFSSLNVIDKDFSFFNKKKNNNRNITCYKCSFDKMTDIVDTYSLYGIIDGIFIDLGISKNQLLNKYRGFNFSMHGFLDMRIDLDFNIRASDWFNFASLDELYSVFSFIEDKRLSKIIINEILYFRKYCKIQTGYDFYKILLKIHYCYNFSFNYLNKVYQFIRVFINNDMQILFNFLSSSISFLKKNGILLVISFNSLEDIIIKNFFLKKNNITTYSVIKPSINELNVNYSSRSAIMRIFIKK